MVKKYSSVILNNGLIKEFEEKPLNPKSTLISTVNYICPKTMLRHIHDAVLNGLVDAPGKLLEYLLNKNVPVKGITLEGTWMDIGDRISYLKANFSYLNNSNFINKQAKIDSLSHIGKNVILSKDCMIQDSIIENSIVLKGAIIKSSRIINSIIGANSSVYSAEIKDMIYEDIF